MLAPQSSTRWARQYGGCQPCGDHTPTGGHYDRHRPQPLTARLARHPVFGLEVERIRRPLEATVPVEPLTFPVVSAGDGERHSAEGRAAAHGAGGRHVAADVATGEALGRGSDLDPAVGVSRLGVDRTKCRGAAPRRDRLHGRAARCPTL